MRIAMVSEHASPLAVLGGVDAGGQNVHVAALAAALARRGAEVVVHTRRDDPHLPDRVRFAPGVTVEHVTAGPQERLPKDELLPHMDEFAVRLRRSWLTRPPDVVHAHFWMSGRAALAAGHPLGLPVVQTFHALGVVKRRHQGAKDTSPPERVAVERAIIRQADAIVATCSDEVFELARLGADLHRTTVVPCGVDLDRFTPHGPAAPRPPDRHRLVVVSRLVERKGIGNAISAVASVSGAELVVAGGPQASRLAGDSQARRLVALAEELGVADRVHLLGRVDQADLPALLRSADVVVCVPWYEPFGIGPARSHGLRRPRNRLGSRRPGRQRGRRRHRPARARPRPRPTRRGPGHAPGRSGPPGGARPGRRAAGAAPLRMGPDRPIHPRGV